MLFPSASAKSKDAKRVEISFKKSYFTARLSKWHRAIIGQNRHYKEVHKEGWAGCSPDLGRCLWCLDGACSCKLHHSVEYMCSSTRMEDVAPKAAAFQIKPLRLWADLGVKGEFRLSLPTTHMGVV